MLLRSVNLRLSYDVNDAVRIESESDFANSDVLQIIDADAGGVLSYASSDANIA